MTDFKIEKSTEHANSWKGSGLVKKWVPLSEKESLGAGRLGRDDNSSLVATYVRRSGMSLGWRHCFAARQLLVVVETVGVGGVAQESS